MLILGSGFQTLYNQTIETAGKPIAEIFTDFHLNINDTSKTTGFGLNRAHLGYDFFTDGNFSGTVIVNIGSPEDLAPGSKARRYAYFREASISYSKDNLKMSLGITGTRLFDFQQKFWGKRYIANTYQSINGYGFVADLGLAIDYKLSELLKADITFMNGEGYSNIQLDNNIRSSFGITITPSDQLAIRLYGDFVKTKGVWQPMCIGFIGFKNSIITIGAEASYKSNLDGKSGHHAWGISGTGAINLTEKTEIFARYDYSTSVVASGDLLPWHYLLDGSFAIFGFQRTLSENVKIALDYQGTFPYAPDRLISDAVFINAVFKF